MRGWDSKTKRKRRNKRQQNRSCRTILLERLSGATKRRDKKKRRDEKGKGTMKKAQ
jgi:hypothetical protein